MSTTAAVSSSSSARRMRSMHHPPPPAPLPDGSPVAVAPATHIRFETPVAGSPASGSASARSHRSAGRMTGGLSRGSAHQQLLALAGQAVSEEDASAVSSAPASSPRTTSATVIPSREHVLAANTPLPAASPRITPAHSGSLSARPAIGFSPAPHNMVVGGTGGRERFFGPGRGLRTAFLAQQLHEQQSASAGKRGSSVSFSVLALPLNPAATGANDAPTPASDLAGTLASMSLPKPARTSLAHSALPKPPSALIDPESLPRVPSTSMAFAMAAAPLHGSAEEAPAHNPALPGRVLRASPRGGGPVVGGTAHGPPVAPSGPKESTFITVAPPALAASKGDANSLHAAHHSGPTPGSGATCGGKSVSAAARPPTTTAASFAARAAQLRRQQMDASRASSREGWLHSPKGGDEPSAAVPQHLSEVSLQQMLAASTAPIVVVRQGMVSAADDAVDSGIPSSPKSSIFNPTALIAASPRSVRSIPASSSRYSLARTDEDAQLAAAAAAAAAATVTPAAAASVPTEEGSAAAAVEETSSAPTPPPGVLNSAEQAHLNHRWHSRSGLLRAPDGELTDLPSSAGAAAITAERHASGVVTPPVLAPLEHKLIAVPLVPQVAARFAAAQRPVAAKDGSDEAAGITTNALGIRVRPDAWAPRRFAAAAAGAGTSKDAADGAASNDPTVLSVAEAAYRKLHGKQEDNTQAVIQSYLPHAVRDSDSNGGAAAGAGVSQPTVPRQLQHAPLSSSLTHLHGMDLLSRAHSASSSSLFYTLGSKGRFHKHSDVIEREEKKSQPLASTPSVTAAVLPKGAQTARTAPQIQRSRTRITEQSHGTAQAARQSSTQLEQSIAGWERDLGLSSASQPVSVPAVAASSTAADGVKAGRPRSSGADIAAAAAPVLPTPARSAVKTPVAPPAAAPATLVPASSGPPVPRSVMVCPSPPFALLAARYGWADLRLIDRSGDHQAGSLWNMLTADEKIEYLLREAGSSLGQERERERAEEQHRRDEEARNTFGGFDSLADFLSVRERLEQGFIPPAPPRTVAPVLGGEALSAAEQAGIVQSQADLAAAQRLATSKKLMGLSTAEHKEDVPVTTVAKRERALVPARSSAPQHVHSTSSLTPAAPPPRFSLLPTHDSSRIAQAEDVSLVHPSSRGSVTDVLRQDAIRSSIVARAEEALTKFNAGVRELERKQRQGGGHRIAELDQGEDLSGQLLHEEASSVQIQAHIPQHVPEAPFSPTLSSSRVSAMAQVANHPPVEDWARDPRPKLLPGGLPGGVHARAHGAGVIHMPLDETGRVAVHQSPRGGGGKTHKADALVRGHGAGLKISAKSRLLESGEAQARAHERHLAQVMAVMQAHTAADAAASPTAQAIAAQRHKGADGQIKDDAPVSSHAAHHARGISLSIPESSPSSSSAEYLRLLSRHRLVTELGSLDGEMLALIEATHATHLDERLNMDLQVKLLEEEERQHQIKLLHKERDRARALEKRRQQQMIQ